MAYFRSMKTNKLIIIIVLSSISLAGLVFIQNRWIQKATRLGEKNFDHRANTAIGESVREVYRKTDTCQLNPLCKNNPILQLVSPIKTDSLLHKYFAYQNLNAAYGFAILRSHDDSIIYKSELWKNIPTDAVIYKNCLSCIYKKEHHYLAVWFPSRMEQVVQCMTIWVVLTVLFISVFTFGYIYLILTYFRQKKVAEMKNDFVNNMTHEFKTPLSTISLASEVLMNAIETIDKEKIKQYAQIIHTENQRMRKQVEQVLQMAILDKGEYELNKIDIDAHAVIRSTVKSLCLERCSKETRIVYELNALDSTINVDPLHFTNIILNLVDNAIKYSGNEPLITISTKNNDNSFCICISDNGIGISSADQEHIFDKFYRVHTGDIHNVKGFGLGLYYVKMLVNAHAGSLNVESELEKGSTFCLQLPQHV